MTNAKSSTPANDASEPSNKFEAPKYATDVNKLMDVARWYYLDEQTKEWIAKELGVDARKVRQWLREAKEAGLVRIDIYEPPSARTEHLESELRRKFAHLQMVKVIPCRKYETNDDYAPLVRRMALEAATFFDEVVGEGKELHVGMSGGESWLEFANAVPDRPRRDVYVYATTLIGRGRLTMSASHVDALVNATILWAKCGREPGHNRYATVPPYDSVRTRLEIAKELQAMADRKPIEFVIREMDEINLAFVGIGVIDPPQAAHRHNARLTMLSLLQPYGPSPKALAEEGAVGEMAGSLFDSQGKTRKDWRFFLSAGHYHPKGGGIEFYKRMVESEKRVVVIGGVQKEVAIRLASGGRPVADGYRKVI